jgi:hypothetical protein
MGIKLDVGANTIKNQAMAKETNRLLFTRYIAKEKINKIADRDKKVGNLNKDVEIGKS